MSLLAYILAAYITMCWYMIVRTYRVANLRIKMREEILSTMTDNLDDCIIALEKYGQTSFNEMVFKFWKPVNSFYTW